MKPTYDKISLIFKETNKDLFEWILKRAEEEDQTSSCFVIHILKKIRAQEAQDAKKTDA